MNELQKTLLPIIILPVIISVFVISFIIYSCNKDKIKNNSFRKKLLEKFSSFFDYNELEYIYQKTVETYDVSNIKKEKVTNFMGSLIPYIFVIQLIFFIIYSLVILKSGDKDKADKLIFFSAILLIAGFSMIPKKKYIEYREKITKQFLNALHPELNYDSKYYECFKDIDRLENVPIFSKSLQENYASESYKLVKEMYLESGFERILHKTWFDMSNYIQCPIELFNFTQIANIRVSGNTRKNSKDYICFEGIISKTPIKNSINSQILITRNGNWLKNFRKHLSF